MKLMNFSSTNCKNCYKCVRTCEVKAIEIKDDQATIVEQKCIACGHCLVVCPQNARDVRSHLGGVKDAINEGKYIVVSLAPSYKSYFEESEKFIAALKKIGFNRIEETAIGAEMVSAAYEKYIKDSQDTEFITTCCPSAVRLIERYYHNLIPCMIPVVSPMVAHGRLIKAENQEAYTVFIGPCISKIGEAMLEDVNGAIDAVLTFDEIISYFHEEEIDYLTLEGKCIDVAGSLRGHRYPIVGGVLNGIRDTIEMRDLELLRVHGMEKCRDVLEALSEGKLKNVCIELNVCDESCIAGPGGINQQSNMFTRLGAIQKFLRKEAKLGNDAIKGLKEIKTKDIQMGRTYEDKQVYNYKPTEEEIQEVLLSMGKMSKKDELNCSACGYNTCHEKAISVLNGMSQIDMCLPYTRSVAERLSNEIFYNSPNGIVLIDSKGKFIDINPKAEELFGHRLEELKGQSISILMDEEPFKEALISQTCKFKDKIVLEEYDLVAYRDIIYLEKQNALLVIFVNITEQEKRKREVGALKSNLIDVTQTIIDKQMRVAQEIASLLGETTGETKVAIIELKKVLEQEGDY